MAVFQGLSLEIFRQRCRATVALVLIWLASLASPTLYAQDQSPVADGAPRYFLFVVESSRSMAPRSQATLDVMQALLNSQFDGQMRRGDLLAAWAFNDTLRKAGPPEKADSQEARATLSVRLLDFVMSQSGDKKARLDNVLPELQPLLRESPFITVILLSSGENEFHGSVCDGLINSSFKRLHDHQHQAQKPLVTVIRSIGGQVTDCKVLTPPGAIKMPPVPAAQAVNREVTMAAIPAETNAVKAASLADAKTTEPSKTVAVPDPGPRPAESALSSKPAESAPPVNSSPAETNAVVEPNTPIEGTAGSARKVAAEPSAAATDVPSSPAIPLPASASSTSPSPGTNSEPQVPPPVAKNEDQNPTARTEPSFASGQSILAQGVRADAFPESTRPAGSPLLGVSAPSAPPRSFLRENGKFLLLILAAVLAAAFCFYNWFKTFAGRSGK